MDDDVVDAGDHLHHPARRLAGVNGVLRIVERRIPESAETFAADALDRPAVGEYLVHQRSEHALQQPVERHRIVAKRSGKGGKAAHAAHEIGDVAVLALEMQKRGLAGDARDGVGTECVGEGIVKARVRPAHFHCARYRARGEGKGDTKSRSRRIQQHAICAEQMPRHDAETGDGEESEDACPAQAETKQKKDRHQTAEKQSNEFGGVGGRRPAQCRVQKNVLQGFGMDLGRRSRALRR